MGIILIQLMLSNIAHFDHKISNPILKLDKKFVSWLLYPLAAFFHPKLIWLAYTLVYYFSGYDIRTTAIYLMGTGLCLLTTYILKRFTKRARPTLNEKVSKPHHFRKKQKNNSMPSGDSIQSALFTCFLYSLGIPLPYLILFHFGVCLARVYYMCHWVLDTVVATILGSAIAYSLVRMREMGAFQAVLDRLLLSQL